MSPSAPGPIPLTSGHSSGSSAVSEELCVLVLDDELPRWLAANATAVLGVALGAHGLIQAGPELPDADGHYHRGIGTIPLPVLSSPREELPALHLKAIESNITVIDFNDAARNSRSYSEYEQQLLAEPVGYLGLALFGARKSVKSVSGNLKSLR